MKLTNKLIKNVFNKYKSIPIPARASLWFVAATMLQKSISFITVPIFTRLMPTVEYGLYSTYISWHSVLTVFCTLNMHSVVYVNNYTKAITKQEKDSAAIPLLSLAECLTIVLFIIYIIFHNFLDRYIKLPFPLVCLLFAQILFEPSINFWSMKQRFEYKYVTLVVRTISMVLLNTILGIIFVWLADSNQAIARVCSIVLIQAIFGGIFYIYFIRQGKKIFSVNNWKRTLQVQLPVLPHSLSLTILSSSDRIMISSIVGIAQAAIYSVAYSAGYVVNVFKNSIVDALRPWLYQKIKSKDYLVIRKTVNTVMILVMLISIVFTAFAPEIIYIMAPREYHDAIYVIPPVAASAYFTFLYNIFSVVGLYYEKTKRIMWASVSGAALNIILNIMFIPIFGYIAAAYTTLLCYIFFSFAHYFIMKSICKSNLENAEIYDIRFILLLSGIMLISTFIFSLTYKNIFIRYAIIFCIAIIMFIKRDRFISVLKELKKGKDKR